LSEYPVKGATRGTKRIDTFFNLRVVHKRRCMVRLSAGIDNQGASAAPVLTVQECTDAIYI
jgi:hypothetical protein